MAAEEGDSARETVRASDAKTHLSRLLDEVERGKTITITRRGVPVAVLAPPDAVRTGHAGHQVADEAEDEERARQAIAAWLRYRDAQPNLRASVAEIPAWVKEGRR
jgi:prevent-host-death family protein